MRTKTLVALYFWILEFDDVTCIRSILACISGGFVYAREVKNTPGAKLREEL